MKLQFLYPLDIVYGAAGYIWIKKIIFNLSSE